MKRLWALAAAAVLSASLGMLTTTTAAYASTGICGTAGVNSGLCMNNWFDDNTEVYAYTSGKSNEDFGAFTIDKCSGSYFVTSTCPFTNTSMDVALEGKEIVQLEYVGGTELYCVGDAPKDSMAYLSNPCNTPSTGTGGAYGSAFVVAGNDSLVDIGWTNTNGVWMQLDSSTSGDQDYFNSGGPGGPTQWSNLP